MRIRFLLTVLIWGCLSVSSVFSNDRLILTTTDFSSGSITVIDLETREATVNLLNIHSDAVVRIYRDRVYVVNRLNQDNILVLSGDDLTTPLLQFSVGNGSNPQDIVFLSQTKAYVSQFGTSRILVVNPATGDSLGGIDLSDFADADGFPEITDLTIYEDRLFAVCQRLNQNGGFEPTDRSELAVVDLTTDTLIDLNGDQEGVQGIILQLKNPFGSGLRLGNKLFLSCVGSFGDLGDGGIEMVNLASNISNGVVMSEAVLGGNLGALAMVSDTTGYAVVTDGSFSNSVKFFNSTTQQTSNVPDVSGGFTPRLAVLGSFLYVADQGSFSDPSSSGLRIIDIASNTMITGGQLSTGLPPSDIAFLLMVPVDPVEASDLNASGTVEFADFLIFVRGFGKVSGETDYNPRLDFSGNGAIDFDDFLVFAGNFGKRFGS